MYVLCVCVCVCICVCMCACMCIYTPKRTHTPISACLGSDAPDLVCGNAAAEHGIRTLQSAARRCSNQGLYFGEPSTFEVGGVGAALQ